MEAANDPLLTRLYHSNSPVIQMAVFAHHDQYDKSGERYIFHPHRVANRVAKEGGSYHAVAAAWLHDVLEDSEVAAEDLLEIVDEGTVRMVIALTHLRNEPYSEYLDRVLAEPGAVYVKHADILDNMAPGRMAALDQETQDRLTYKYVRALEHLKMS